MSMVCTTEVVVLKAPSLPVSLECGGTPMTTVGTVRPAGSSIAAGRDAGTLLGKRYADEPSGLELLCTKGGAGSLSVDGRKLIIRTTAALPSSD